jgi:predicted DsbA family dithiol-disulfide isomerase
MLARLFNTGFARGIYRAVARPHSALIPLVLHGDPLDPWGWIAENRIVRAADELHGRFEVLEHAALPLRWAPRAPSPFERRRRAREVEKAAQEPDAPPFSSELWTNGHAPQSSAPALVAVAAARLQGPLAAVRLRHALREAALVSGLDVSRRDVIIEIAARTELDFARFLPAFEAPGTERALLNEIRAAGELGVESCPSLVIGGEWLVAGPRSLADYRVLLKRYLEKRAGTPVEYTVH